MDPESDYGHELDSYDSSSIASVDVTIYGMDGAGLRYHFTGPAASSDLFFTLKHCVAVTRTEPEKVTA